MAAQARWQLANCSRRRAAAWTVAQWSTPKLADDAERRSRLGVGSRRYVLYVGDCDYRKNVRGMFASLALARREEDVELVWAGDLRGPKAPRMKALAEEYGVGDAVRFLGYVADADLGPLYRDAVAAVRAVARGVALVDRLLHGKR